MRKDRALKSCLTTEQGERGLVASAPRFSPTLGGATWSPWEESGCCHLPGCGISKGQGAGARRRNVFLPAGFLPMWKPAGLPTHWPRERTSLSPSWAPGGVGKVEIKEDGGIFQSGVGSEISSGLLSPSRGEVRRIKVTDGPAIVGKRHMCSRLHGGRCGGTPGFDKSDRGEVTDGL